MTDNGTRIVPLSNTFQDGIGIGIAPGLEEGKKFLKSCMRLLQLQDLALLGLEFPLQA